MSPAKSKPAEVAAEAKKTYIPYIRQKWSQTWPAYSYLVSDSSTQMACERPEKPLRTRIGVIEGDPVDVALDWARNNDESSPGDVPVISMANEKRPGGDWEASVMAPEECLCRRSNLYATLTTPGPGSVSNSHYPIPEKGGVYSPHVVVFRSGPDQYQLWKDFEALPIISVPPVRRPKLDAAGKKYSFSQEFEIMQDKIRTALRIAVWYEFTNIIVGAWGCGPIFRNPSREVATMWRDIIFFEDEFEGQFRNVVFAFNDLDAGVSSTSGSTKSSKSSKSSASSTSKSTAKADMQIFLDVFDPAKVFKDPPKHKQR